ncbi:alpha/beta hydrolase [Nocardia sp. NPDC005366]|uniref:alpha/beta hydrolase n=1 Tax=Nocardia sp. NPDC005366 TaxID=3156878 RepID=UPI00339E65DA
MNSSLRMTTGCPLASDDGDVRSWKKMAVAALVVALPVSSGCGPVTEHESAVAELVAQADAVPTPQLDWAVCAEPGLSRYECATAAVPLDYASPDGETITLAVVRQPASDPAHRIGTLFAAVGGPGGSGLEWAAKGALVPGEVSRRFDVVTFDQRGVGRSARVKCFANDEEKRGFWTATTIPPVTAEQQAAAERAARALAAGCAAYSGALLPHLTTVDAARDLDLLRRAVGDSQLTYLGGSHASYLGQVYGALFGERVRALQLSAVLDPDAYTRDATAAVLDTATGAEDVLGEFLRLCASAKTACAFAEAPISTAAGSTERGTSGRSTGDLRARYDALLAGLARGPITVGSGEHAVQVTYAQVVAALTPLLYDPGKGWPAMAELLAALDSGHAGNADAVRAILAAGALDVDFLDSFTAISCADSTFARQPEIWPQLASRFAATAPTYGAFLLYLRQPCAAWQAPADGYPQRYTGPWTLSADKPALLINNRFDPATPLPFAQRAQQAMVNARLVVVSDGYGHDPDNECARHLRERYLVDLQLPAPGATCSADSAPFAR